MEERNEQKSKPHLDEMPHDETISVILQFLAEMLTGESHHPDAVLRR